MTYYKTEENETSRPGTFLSIYKNNAKINLSPALLIEYCLYVQGKRF